MKLPKMSARKFVYASLVAMAMPLSNAHANLIIPFGYSIFDNGAVTGSVVGSIVFDPLDLTSALGVNITNSPYDDDAAGVSSLGFYTAPESSAFNTFVFTDNMITSADFVGMFTPTVGVDPFRIDFNAGSGGGNNVTLSRNGGDLNFPGVAGGPVISDDGVNVFSFVLPATEIPTPTSFALLGAGLFGFVLSRQRRRLDSEVSSPA